MGIKNLQRLPVNLLFFPCNTQWFQIFYLVHVNSQVWSFITVIWSFPQTKTKTELFWTISVPPKRNIKSNDFELLLSRQTCQRNNVVNYASGIVTKTGNNHKWPQTMTNDHKPPANDHKWPKTTSNNHKHPQTANKRLQTTNKWTLITRKQPQTATPAHQIKHLTLSFFFPYPLIKRNTLILKNILFTLHTPPYAKMAA